MGWNTSVLLAEGKTLAEMKRAIPDVFAVTKRTVGWEDASSTLMGQDLALGELPGWGVIWTPNIRVSLFPDVLEAASRSGRAIMVVLSSVSDIYGFCIWAKGKEVRRLIRSEGETTEETGSLLPEEAALDWEDGEDAMFGLVRRLTGLDVASFDLWERVRFVIASLDL